MADKRKDLMVVTIKKAVDIEPLSLSKDQILYYRSVMLDEFMYYCPTCLTGWGLAFNFDDEKVISYNCTYDRFWDIDKEWAQRWIKTFEGKNVEITNEIETIGRATIFFTEPGVIPPVELDWLHKNINVSVHLEGRCDTYSNTRVVCDKFLAVTLKKWIDIKSLSLSKSTVQYYRAKLIHNLLWHYSCITGWNSRYGIGDEDPNIVGFKCVTEDSPINRRELFEFWIDSYNLGDKVTTASFDTTNFPIEFITYDERKKTSLPWDVSSLMSLNSPVRRGSIIGDAWARVRSLLGVSIAPITTDRFIIGNNLARVISSCLNDESVKLRTVHTLQLEGVIEWYTSTTLTMISKSDIIFSPSAEIRSLGGGKVFLKAGIENPEGHGRVIFEGRVQVLMQGGELITHYNPVKGDEKHKYHNPEGYFPHMNKPFKFTAYMLVNNVQDLQDINYFLHGNYALSQNINASITKDWNKGKGFSPIGRFIKRSDESCEEVPFSGDFDGNGYVIRNMFINYEHMDNVGLFSLVSGGRFSYTKVSNVVIEDFYIRGDHGVGCVSGDAEYASFSNIKLISSNHVVARAIAGGVIGRGSGVIFSDIDVPVVTTDVGDETLRGMIAGAIRDSEVQLDYCCIDEEIDEKCVGRAYNSRCDIELEVPMNHKWYILHW